MTNVYVGLGGNLDDSEKYLTLAAQKIAQCPDFKKVQVSSLYKTEPIDASGPDYLNAVMKLETELEPDKILDTLLQIERELGRERPAGIHNAPRVVDCDLLLAGDNRLDSAFLTLPHPRMHERAFTLVPCLELNPKLSIPGRGLAVDMLKKIKDQRVEKYKAPQEWFRKEDRSD